MQKSKTPASQQGEQLKIKKYQILLIGFIRSILFIVRTNERTPSTFNFKLSRPEFIERITLNLHSGQSLVELLIAIGLAAIILPALITAFVSSFEGKVQTEKRLEATTLLKETQEIVRSVREKGWSTFAVNGTYHPTLSGSTWSLTSGTTTVNGFIQSIVISDVSRDDTTNAIVTTGGTVDPSTKKVDITISWTEPIANQVASTSYVTRYLENDAYLETTQTDFNGGTKTGVAVRSTSGSGIADDGEIVLGAGGQGSWCIPNITEYQLDLPKNGVANALSAIEGKVVVGTGENASGVSFAEVNVSGNPPNPTLESTFDGYKTNDVFIEGNYGYVATDTNSKEVVILDLTQNPPTEIGYMNAPGNTDGASVYVTNNVGYVITGNRLYSFNLSAKTGSRPLLDTDGVHLTATGYKVVVIGSYAYVATGGSTRDFVLINVSNSSNLTLVGGTITNATNARDIAVKSDGSRVYLATDSSSAYEQSEFFIINTSNKSLSTFPIVGTFNSGFLDLKGVAVAPGNVAIIVGQEYGGDETDEYQVLDISNESSPTRCGSANVEASIRGVDTVLEADGDAYSYIIVGENPELRILEGGPGGQYATEGAFESKTFVFAPNYLTAFNRYQVNFTKPASTNIRLQFAVADPSNGNCSTATFQFVGPNANPSAFFTETTGSIPFNRDGTGYENPGKCLKYKVYLDTTDENATPIFHDITINYSP